MQLFLVLIMVRLGAEARRLHLDDVGIGMQLRVRNFLLLLLMEVSGSSVLRVSVSDLDPRESWLLLTLSDSWWVFVYPSNFDE